MSVLKRKVDCFICQKELAKYKCSICEVPYCSLGCYKKHKETPCTAKVVKAPPIVLPPSSAGNVKPDPLTEAQLSQLADNEDLRELISHPELQRVLHEINSAQNPEEVYDKAMMYAPGFQELKDLIVDTVERKKTLPEATHP
ncbi:zinc finger HIT domain-containing protein 3-like protein [Phlyctochytrium arcticum]|nr:zinc finger HIT domain-containing protein 3-like protein [Phlyctochytrium arcticum]